MRGTAQVRSLLDSHVESWTNLAEHFCKRVVVDILAGGSGQQPIDLGGTAVEVEAELGRWLAGEAILARVGRIVYPLKASSVGVPALRAAVINGLAQGDGRLSAIGFLKAYPTDEMEVSIPALLAVLKKASSVSELVKFFSESPLDGLRGSQGQASDTPAQKQGS